MLRFLSIQNLAVIEAVTIDFHPGLSVLTGETGAGKSILVEAVGLLLGGRASGDLVRTGADAATVQAVFDGPDGQELLVRREVTAQGRSRAFVDGSLVTVNALREMASNLVDLHGQHEHQSLLDPDIHLDLLDQYAGLDAARALASDAFEALQAARSERDAARRMQEQRAQRAELLEFQLGELNKTRPRAGEDEELASLRALLASAERVRRLSDESYDLLYERDEAALAVLGQVWKRVAELAALDARFSAHLEQRDGIKSQLEDLASLLRGYSASLDASPARRQEVEDRLALLERLKRKHGPTLADVVARHAALSKELDMLATAGERLDDAERVVHEKEAVYLGAASALSAQRRSAAARLARELERELADLAMAQTRFEVVFAEGLPAERWGPRGTDVAEFYVSPNPGEDLRPLARIVSGGEMSRVMLALKNLASLDQPGKTLIFDEVDSGIGGRVADSVGRKLRVLGGSFQVLCITHLPQIAAYGDNQYRIEKQVLAGRTTTRVEQLDRRGREDELARMLGGATVSDAARQSAREMLRANAGESENKTKGESDGMAKGESESSRRAKAKALRPW